MAEVKFSANEIKRQAGRLREQTDRYMENASKIIEELIEIRSTIGGPNNYASMEFGPFSKNLAGELHELQAAYETLNKTTFKNKFYEIADRMDEWANKTIANEEETTSNVTSSISDLEIIKHILSLVK